MDSVLAATPSAASAISAVTAAAMIRLWPMLSSPSDISFLTAADS